MGLYLEVSPAGSKRWFLKLYPNGKETRLALGSYPDVGLPAARRARDAAKLKKAEGIDPIQARKIEKLKAINPAGDSFEVVAREWYDCSASCGSSCNGRALAGSGLIGSLIAEACRSSRATSFGNLIASTKQFKMEAISHQKT